MKLPNCSLCCWRMEFAPDKKEKKGRPGCSAQGYIDCAKAYGTRDCRKLFKSMDKKEDSK